MATPQRLARRRSRLSHNGPVSLPLAEYTARLAARRATYDALTRRDARVAGVRLALFAVAIGLGTLAWRGVVSAWLLAVPGVAFLFLAVHHDRVLRARDRARRAVAFYDRGLARLEDRWQGTGANGLRFLSDGHPYAADLDIFGKGSLFELLSIARTQAGEATLAGWLNVSAPPDEILARQEAVQELTGALDLRESFAAEAATVGTSSHAEALVAWAEGPPVLTPPWLRPVAASVTAATMVTLLLYGITGNEVPLLWMLAVQSVFAAPQGVRVLRALHGADGPARDLDVLRHLLGMLEREQFSAPRLTALRAQIVAHGETASVAIRHLQRLVERHDWQHNAMFVPIGLMLMWGTHVAWAIEGWRRRHGRHVAPWLQAVGEFEALVSLSAYRYEHPADPFPQLRTGTADHAGGAAPVPASGPLRPAALFDGTQLGHPLLATTKAVRNDVRLDAGRRLLIVSGSNMSGKSTLLRTVGVNAVLAFAGAPVRATRLQLSPLAIGATLRIQDSLLEGRSRFYAEITRLRELAEIARGPLPLLFLLDELLHGTNSHDRLVGATGVLRSLLDTGAIGLVTTHDLALTAVNTQLTHAANVHFEEWFEAGEMRFDYTVKAGPVTRSNALALMRAVGLDV
jgi:hypothetical protein